MARNSIHLEGFDELERKLRSLERVPQKVATIAAQAGGRILTSAAKRNAPVDTGALKKGLKMIAEKPRQRKRGKKMYTVSFPASLNETFVKISAEGNRSYYPVSQEHGFDHVSGKRVEGTHYMARAFDENKEKIEQKIVSVGLREIDKVLRG